MKIGCQAVYFEIRQDGQKHNIPIPKYQNRLCLCDTDSPLKRYLQAGKNKFSRVQKTCVSDQWRIGMRYSFCAGTGHSENIH